MPKIVTVAEMKALEAAAERAGVGADALMENAGRQTAEAILARLGDDLAAHKVLVVCGKGHNGGDGLVAAHYLANAGARVSVYLQQPGEPADPKRGRLRERGVYVAEATADSDGQVLQRLLASATVVVDAVLGTGARLPLTGAPAALLRAVGAGVRARTPRPFVVAVDCPSGLDCDTGALDALTLPADLTVTFAALRRGQLAFPGAEAVGELVVAEIGLPADLPEWQALTVALLTADQARRWLPARPRQAHKGTFGRALVAAGSVNYVGAAYLAGAAAYRVGAGLVTLGVPETLYALLAGRLLEATWGILPEAEGGLAEAGADWVRAEAARATALLVGPGLGQRPATRAFLSRLFPGPALPTVVDADALRLLAALPDWPARLPAPAVLTPHPGEMAALTGLDTAAIQADRLETARAYAARWGHVVVLKGAHTVVAAPAGEAWVAPFATAALARAGTGDVLAGAVVGLLAQGVPAFEAAALAVYLHGRAGELAAAAQATTASVLAGDVLAALGPAQAELLR